MQTSVSLLTAVVTAVVVFFFAAALTSYRNSRTRLQSARGVVKNARKAVRTSISSLFKVGFCVVLLLLVVVVSRTDDGRSGSGGHPTPSPSVTRR